MTISISTSPLNLLSDLLAAVNDAHAEWFLTESDSEEERLAGARYSAACGAASAAIEVAVSAVEITVEYDEPIIEEMGGVTYASHDASLTIGAATAEARSWSLCGWIAAGASGDLDGSGLENWGDSQPGGWSTCDGDGHSSGRVGCRAEEDEEEEGVLISAAEGGPNTRMSLRSILALSESDALTLNNHVLCGRALLDLSERIESACDDARPTVSEPSGEEVWAALDNSRSALEMGDSVRVGRPWGESQTLVVVCDADGEKTAYLESDYWEDAVRTAVAAEAVDDVEARIARNERNAQ